MIKRLERFYATFGDKGVMFCLYALTLVINVLFTISVELPSVLTQEISSAGAAAFYSGKNWGALLEVIGVDGYIQQLLYAPMFSLFKTPYAIYKAMLIENAILISFVPIIAYHLAAKIGIVKVRRKLMCALCSGMYVTYIANSKLIWNNVSAGLLTWILVWCIFAAWDKKNRYTRFVTSVVTGFLCALGYASDKRMIVVAAAVVLTAVIARYGFKERIFNLPVLAGSLVISFVTEHFARLLVMRFAANGAEDTLPVLFSDSVGGGVWGRIFCEGYAFITESFGMGAIAAAAFGTIVAVYIKERIKNKPKILDDNTKVYEAVKHKYSVRVAVFGLFESIAVLLSIIAFSTFTFCGETAEFSKICTGLDYIAPLSVFFTLVYIVLYGLDLHKLFISVGIYSFICAIFTLTYYSSGAFAQEGKTVAMLPLRIGEGFDQELTGMSFIIMSSCVFSIFAMLIVVTACSRKQFMKLITIGMYGILIYNTAYVGFRYIPEAAAIASEKTASYKSVSDLLYNNTQSPMIVVAYDSEKSRELAGMIQFLNFNTKVSIIKDGDRVPESCLLVAENSVKAPFDRISYDVVGKTSDYTVYAYGEIARDFIRYSSTAGGGNTSSE
ncbi:MAG: hypothetical protein J1F03_04175 [Oscillospiraceae bacterium]|nr:hypothetical protein [Oscillospiraceae bacterium]